MPFQLTISEGREAGKEFVFDQDSVLIGRSTDCDVALFDPGPTATNLRATAMPGEDPATLRQPAEVGAAIAELIERGFHAGAVLRLLPRTAESAGPQAAAAPPPTAPAAAAGQRQQADPVRRR